MKILMIVAQEGFQDHEYGAPRQIFEQKGFAVDVASIEKGTAKGKFGKVIDVGLAVKDASLDDYNAVVVVGGPGALKLGEYAEVIELIRKTANSDKLLAAICISPALLAKAGVLEGRKATIWNEDGEKFLLLEKGGAAFVDKNVVVDGNIITANGPGAAEEFGNKIVELLS